MEENLILEELAAHGSVLELLKRDALESIRASAELLTKTASAGGRILLFGNGGSAADSQHIAAELVNRFMTERKALAAIALTTDSSILTSVANDRDFHEIFARQVEALGRVGDTAVGLSTSGRSRNVSRGLQSARQLGMATIALVGLGGGPVAEEADFVVSVPSDSTPRIQEMHILIGHIWCLWIDRAFRLGDHGVAV